MMKNQTSIFIAVCIICFLFYRCSNNATTSTATNDSLSTNGNMYNGYASQVDWGKHLMATGGCGDCHTPKKMADHGPVDDSSLLFSGSPSQQPAPNLTPDQLKQGMAATLGLTAWTGPWGRSYAANLTPDSTGLGSWSEKQFITCLSQGLFQGIEGSRPLMPPMPIDGVKNFTSNEMKAIFAFLKTVKPIHNIVPEYQPPATAAK
ncbi:MAG: diheme cytochrome c-553 [Parafilimonas sp.]